MLLAIVFLQIMAGIEEGGIYCVIEKKEREKRAKA